MLVQVGPARANSLALPGTHLKGPQIQADPIGLGSSDSAGFDQLLIVRVVGRNLTMAAVTLVRPCLVLTGSSQSPSGNPGYDSGLSWPVQASHE